MPYAKKATQGWRRPVASLTTNADSLPHSPVVRAVFWALDADYRSFANVRQRVNRHRAEHSMRPAADIQAALDFLEEKALAQRGFGDKDPVVVEPGEEEAADRAAAEKTAARPPGIEKYKWEPSTDGMQPIYAVFGSQKTLVGWGNGIANSNLIVEALNKDDNPMPTRLAHSMAEAEAEGPGRRTPVVDALKLAKHLQRCPECHKSHNTGDFITFTEAGLICDLCSPKGKATPPKVVFRNDQGEEFHEGEEVVAKMTHYVGDANGTKDVGEWEEGWVITGRCWASGEFDICHPTKGTVKSLPSLVRKKHNAGYKTVDKLASQVEIGHARFLAQGEIDAAESKKLFDAVTKETDAAETQKMLVTAAKDMSAAALDAGATAELVDLPAGAYRYRLDKQRYQDARHEGHVARPEYAKYRPLLPILAELPPFKIDDLVPILRGAAADQDRSLTVRQLFTDLTATPATTEHCLKELVKAGLLKRVPASDHDAALLGKSEVTHADTVYVGQTSVPRVEIAEEHARLAKVENLIDRLARTTCNHSAQAIDAIEKFRDEALWKKLTKRGPFPEDGASVLATVTGDDVFGDFDKPETVYCSFLLECHTHKNVFVSDRGHRLKVTAWMYPPKPYKGV